ncbi:metalloprotease TldD [Psychromonas sp. Urea-02u-13]|uniref:metalloprotease TldD n=1 Tax=Psychromonas sp. Urea-02u-13 TaxID=2058326 RepID=UPI000C32CBAC|nr:metalloprotease TldD [Psychromonas sp. Urea-02u-13]PKG39649.1 metalloprotease TldD [Psychromonas sp. Urea-02u-13]
MSFEQVCERFLAPAQLSLSDLQSQLGRISTPQIDYADFYFQSSRHESWVLEDGIVKDGSYNIDKGVGIRAVSGEKTGFAYADQISKKSITDAASAARSIVKSGQERQIKLILPTDKKLVYGDSDPLSSLPQAKKIALLKEVDVFTRALDPAVCEVTVSLNAVYEEILVAASDGTLATDIRPLVRFSCSVLIEKNGKREHGSAGGGGRFDLDYFTDTVEGETKAFSYARAAVRQALINIDAIDAPAGSMPVIIGAGWPGVLLHEAVGHGLEGDFNRKGSSAYSGKIGEQVASKHCTIIDDGTIKDRRGSINIDDEGTIGQRNVLIENGILKGYMQDKLNARLMGVAPTGNGRRESYAHLPLPRMTNTFMLNGEHEHEELISSVKKGIYAPNFGGGQVDITSGKFVFSASEAYLIEDGKVTAPIKGATLIGNGFDAMQQISMVANNMKLDPGVGVCGKEGQSIPVGVGQPSVKIDQLTVGGTN